MQYLFQQLFSKLKKSYFYPEIKQLSRLAVILVLAWSLFTYGSVLVHLAASQRGMIYIAFFMLSVVLALVIKLYFRIMIIKYGGEAQRHINLLEEKH